MTTIERFVRRCAKRTTRNGAEVLITDGDPLLVAAFASLGWDDPHQDMHQDIREEAATVEAPERAALPKAKGRTT